MRSIVCSADHQAAFDDRLETALALARATRGHLSLLIATPMSQLMTWEPFGGPALSAEAIRVAREDDDALAVRVKERLVHQDVPFDITTADMDRVEALGDAARLADVIVMGIDDVALKEVAIGVRCPVLAVPRGKPLLAFDGTVLIAWNGSREAANAMRAALPLLKLAAAVHVLAVGEDGLESDPGEALRYLSRHDIHAELHNAQIGAGGTVAGVIAQTAATLDCGLVVMGVYGHSRLRELLLGGVSRTLLGQSDRALLLAH
ncbi:universal stress protein [Novosphingobium lentum]|uniref:universal stress protein n=1 Tax=Novosphingobium lentum TaxID=145287 RepID=UPI00083383BE|nr:universal stress protein [Novosphingobium lentum]